MKRLLFAALSVVALSAINPSSSLALSARFDAARQDTMNKLQHPTTSTSNALPLLDTFSVRGRVANIDGSKVQIERLNGNVETYKISYAQQKRVGLAVGSEVTLEVRRLNNAVISVGQ